MRAEVSNCRSWTLLRDAEVTHEAPSNITFDRTAGSHSLARSVNVSVMWQVRRLPDKV